MEVLKDAFDPVLDFADSTYAQFQSVLQSNLPIDTIRKHELDFLKFFNPELRSLSQLPTRAWPMTRVEEVLALVVVYLLFVVAGSNVMKAIYGPREAPKGQMGNFTKLFMLLYNGIQVALCAAMIMGAVDVYQKEDYSVFCNDFSLRNKTMAAVTWVFFMSKILDFFDTVFIVFRRKWRQLSFLHVYHHSSIFFIYWLNVNVGFDGDIYYTVILNSFIHLVMYFYYGCTTVGIQVPSPLKRLVTHSQRIQFVAMNLQAAFLLYNNCQFPQRITIMYLVYIISLLVLFTDFDKKTYSKKSSKKTK